MGILYLSMYFWVEAYRTSVNGKIEEFRLRDMARKLMRGK